ncbi:hypothetical protein E8E13_011577 [Curvularia kusanoi]|uniref:Uncharacterized protein n=1 Tax=Curvularia kusanoi TaxID=90978 RepID=A0A9P4TPJ9_CURKU|nr:hypothetical protein E8E13_011577 [Curvularia kusanoi]
MPTLNDRKYKEIELSRVALPVVLDSLPDSMISQRYSKLYDATIKYVRKYYTDKAIDGGGASQLMVEQASAGVLLPWPDILDLLNNRETRLGMLVMCIGRIMFSRMLLLKLGTGNNSLGATLLPPEVIDCFQSFCFGRSALTMDGKEPKPLNLALLSRWKQITATLLQATYEEDAFSPFDARTINIERAMEDLGPLLNSYAIPNDAGFEKGSRVRELRDIVRMGAQFAFTLFSQPCLWSFDWYHNREIEAAEGQLHPEKIDKFKSDAARSEAMRFSVDKKDIVIWPSLLRVTDSKGCKLAGEEGGVKCGEKKYLKHVLS